jgi:hypothetical protein
MAFIPIKLPSFDTTFANFVTVIPHNLVHIHILCEYMDFGSKHINLNSYAFEIMFSVRKFMSS